jgi:hypothetical protein
MFPMLNVSRAAQTMAARFVVFATASLLAVSVPAAEPVAIVEIPSPQKALEKLDAALRSFLPEGSAGETTLVEEARNGLDEMELGALDLAGKVEILVFSPTDFPMPVAFRVGTTDAAALGETLKMMGVAHTQAYKNSVVGAFDTGALGEALLRAQSDAEAQKLPGDIRVRVEVGRLLEMYEPMIRGMIQMGSQQIAMASQQSGQTGDMDLSELLRLEAEIYFALLMQVDRVEWAAESREDGFWFEKVVSARPRNGLGRFSRLEPRGRSDPAPASQRRRRHGYGLSDALGQDHRAKLEPLGESRRRDHGPAAFHPPKRASGFARSPRCGKTRWPTIT